MTELEVFISDYETDIAGVVDDFEVYPFSAIYYKSNGDISSVPSLDYSDRIDGISFDGRPNFRDYANYPIAYDLSTDNIRYNFSKVSVVYDKNEDESNLFGFMLGYPLPGYEHHYQRVVQTFKPNNSKITRIDVRIKRYTQISEDYTQLPEGSIAYYLTKTDQNGIPLFDSTSRLTGMRYLSNYYHHQGKQAIDWLGEGQNNFGIGTSDEILPLKLYFNPYEIGDLDVTQTYAVVLEYTDWVYTDCNNGHYRVAAIDDNNNGPYPDGKLFKYTSTVPPQTVPYPDTDMWFKIYYPDPPTNNNPSVSQTDYSQRIQLLGYSSDHYKMAQTFEVGDEKISILKLKLEIIGSSLDRNFRAYISKTDVNGIPNDNIISSVRVFGEDLTRNYS